MPERAKVRSVDAIVAFRANLIVFLNKARPLMDEVNADLRRTSLWLQTDQRTYWERELRRRERAMNEARQALFSARMSGLRDATAFEEGLVHKARVALEEAEGKTRRIKLWIREFGPRTEILVRQLDGLDSFLGHDMGKAVALLTELIRHLDAYAEIHSPNELPVPRASSTAEPGAGVEVQGMAHPEPGRAGQEREA